MKLDRIDPGILEAKAIVDVASFAVQQVPEGKDEVRDSIGLLMSAAHTLAIASGMSPMEAVESLRRVLDHISNYLKSELS